MSDGHSERRGAMEMIPLALHSGLTSEEQLRVFQPAERNTRKVIAATNIAEVRPILFLNYSLWKDTQASVTIDGVKFVVDCGFVKVCFSPFVPSYFYGSSRSAPIIQLHSCHRCLRFQSPSLRRRKGLVVLVERRLESATDYILRRLLRVLHIALRQRSHART